MDVYQNMTEFFAADCLKRFALIALCTFASSSSSLAQEQTTFEIVSSTAPTLNFYGLPGIIDMPSGEAMQNAQVALGFSHFAGTTRSSFSFQFSPRITATFRYSGLKDYNGGSGGTSTYWDRSFDFRYLLLKEKAIQPALTVGLQDFAGTGIYSAEYLVMTKNFLQPFGLSGNLKVTAGLGWGRLSSYGSVGSPLGGTRPTWTGLGGEPSADQWFRGPMAPFGGIEWQISDKIGLKAEYSNDAYNAETSANIIDRKSQFNFGAEYEVSKGFRLGAYYLYGSEIGVNAQIQFNPNRPSTPFNLAGPRPVIVRPSRATSPESYGTSWAELEDAPSDIQKVIGAELEDVGIKIEAVSVSPNRVELRVHSNDLTNQAIVVGRVARSMARILPDSVETFDIVLMNNSLAMSKVSVQRNAIETQEFKPNASAALLPFVVIGDADPSGPESAFIPQDQFPRFSWDIGPFLALSFFDPAKPIRADAGIEVSGNFNFAPGWFIGGKVRHKLIGNSDKSPVSGSALPAVRTEGPLYDQAADTYLKNLYISKQWKPSRATYARVTVGYFEQMYGGLSSELLWQPADSPLGLGVEANYVKKRDYDQRLGFQDYDIVTGHASVYYNFNENYLAQVDAGRYLAGDYGATFRLSREFANGWEIGGFFTKTDVSAADFGEGSFDKGFFFKAPLDWFTGTPSKQTIGQNIRIIQRDGGQRVYVPKRLYNQVRSGQQNELLADWGRVWE